MLVEPILIVVDIVHCREESVPPDIDFPPLGLHAGDVEVSDHHLHTSPSRSDIAWMTLQYL